MGKASKWLRGILGLKKSERSSSSTPKPPKEKQRRWSFVKSYREEQQQQQQYNHPHSTGNSPATFQTEHSDNKHAIAVAAATAAAAEVAVAAAQAAAAVVRLTSSSNNVRIREEWAAVKIQAAFRGSLARKALRALKGLVKLQALVRGQIERKRTAEWLKTMQALLRAQTRATAGRTLHTSYSSAKQPSTCQLHSSGPATPEKFESPVKSKSTKHDQQSPVHKRNGSKSCVLLSGNEEGQLDEQSWKKVRSLVRTYARNEEKGDRMLEIDSGKPHFTSKRRNLSYSNSEPLGSEHCYSKSLTTTKSSEHSSSCEVQSHNNNNPLKPYEVDETPFCTASNSPQFFSATSKDDGCKRSPFSTPTKSDGSRSYLRGYSDYPGYMAYTESSKAKARSLSAPKQRPQQYERSCSSSRYSLNGFEMSRLAAQKTLQESFTSKAYPGSGRLDKLGMPVGYRF